LDKQENSATTPLDESESHRDDDKLGKKYFDTRSRLGNAVYALARLAENCGVSPSHVGVLRNLMANLKDPFLFVVAGEVNAGKSTLLNGLFGADFCPADVVPTTDRICYFKYGSEEQEMEVGENLVELYRPNEFLRDFNVVDTPGTNSIESEHQQITEQFVPMADLVIFVFSVTNPWGASTWQLLDQIHGEWHKNIVFVLQQSDLRSEEEVAAILEHLKAVTSKRYRTVFPTFALSGKKALMAKTSGLDKEKLRADSGFDAFEHYISDVVEGSEIRTTKIVNTWRSARHILGIIKDKLKNAAEIIRVDNELLGGLEGAVEIQENRTREKFEPLYEAFDKSYLAATIKAEDILDSRLGIFSSLKSAGDLPEGIEQQIRTLTLHSVKRNIGSGAAVVRDDVDHLWKWLSNGMQQHFGFKLSVGETGEPNWEPGEYRVCDLTEKATRESLNQLHMASHLEPVFSQRRRRVWGFLIAALVCFGAGGLLTWKALMPWNFAAFGLGGVVLLIAALVANRSIESIRNAYADAVEAQRKVLQESQRNAFNKGIRSFFADFVTLFDPLREVCQDNRERYGPQLEARDDLEKTFDRLAAHLAPDEEQVNEVAKQNQAVAAPTPTASSTDTPTSAKGTSPGGNVAAAKTPGTATAPATTPSA
jgi:small GTP-binding protein